MIGEHALAMGIKLLGEGANLLFPNIVGKWKGERIETMRLRVSGSVFKRASA
jgi:hypothetical protein